MKVKLTEEQIENMSYADVAFLILNSDSKKIKIQDLFKKVIKAMQMSDDDYAENIGDFFELLLIDKRFIMLENGFCDLKINHSTKIVFDDEDDDDDIELVEENDEAMDDDAVVEEISYDDEDTVEDDSEDELDDLIVMDESDDDGDML